MTHYDTMTTDQVILACRDVERGEAAARDIAGDSIHVR